MNPLRSRRGWTRRPWLSAGPVLALWLVALLPVRLGAWGPHPAITQAALDTLGTNHPLVLQLGAYTVRLTNYSWLADYKGVPYRDVDQHFYADDYLLFPAAPTHFDHICPEVKRTYRPYLLRALQALETEDAANAARWIGSLVHFVEDTGSPPHAAEIRGGIHSNMENWVEAHRIHIPGYRPALLGTNAEDAVQGLERRMDELIAYSKERAMRVRLFVELGNRSSTLPIVLESALETSRATADLLHTLGWVAAHVRPTNSAMLTGRVMSQAPVGMESFPARLVVEETSYSTLTDGDGRFALRHLPEGLFKVAVFRPGNGVYRVAVPLKAGRTNQQDFVLPGARGDLVRNGNFAVRWVKASTPDCWRVSPGRWEGEIIPLQTGQRYRLEADFAPGTTGDVFVRWTRQLPHELPKILQGLVPFPRIENRVLTPAEPTVEFTGSESMALLQVTLRGTNEIDRLCHAVRLLPLR